ncbi:MAG: nucleotidyltransferase family protein [Desulfobacterales bacterium]
MCAITPSDMEIYRRTARRNKEALEQRRRLWEKYGWSVAEKAASLLKQKFSADRVVVFGSLIRPGHFDERSDVDIAVSGVADSDFLQAVAAVTALDREITVDLIQIEQASPSLCRQVEEGLEI